MESRAVTRGAKISAQKLRLVVSLVRGRKAEDAIGVLEFTPKSGARVVTKTLKAAIANAESTQNVDVDRLYVKAAYVDEGRTEKRFMPRAHGRATPIFKRSSHVTIIVDERPDKA